MMTTIIASTLPIQFVRFETSEKEVMDVILFLSERKDDMRIWSLFRLVLEYDRENDSAEKENILRTINEILINQKIMFSD